MSVQQFQTISPCFFMNHWSNPVQSLDLVSVPCPQDTQSVWISLACPNVLRCQTCLTLMLFGLDPLPNSQQIPNSCSFCLAPVSGPLSLVLGVVWSPVTCPWAPNCQLLPADSAPCPQASADSCPLSSGFWIISSLVFRSFQPV